MEILLEVAIYLVFACGLSLFHWCMKNKNIALTFVAVILIVVDVFVWLKVMGKY